MKKVLVVAVHPDDETLGCGGTLLKHKASGDEIYWLIVTRTYAEDGFSEKFIHKRQKEIARISEVYGFTNTFECNLPATRLDELPTRQLVTIISEVFQEVQPQIIYLPFKSDVHSDHRVVFDAAYSCSKAFRNSSIERILMMEALSETEFAPACQGSFFIPNAFSDITPYLDQKIKCMSMYKSELGKHPFPRSKENIKALAVFRGASSGYQYAEAFQILRDHF